MYYEKYLVPGNRECSIVIGPTDVLMQVVEEGVMVHEFKNKQLVREAIIPKLTEEAAATMQLLGVAEAGDVPLCFWMAIKTAPDFLPVLAGYALRPPEMKDMKIGVAFYSKREVLAETVDMTASSACGGLLVGGGHA